jgi:hypothetical protein
MRHHHYECLRSRNGPDSGRNILYQGMVLWIVHEQHRNPEISSYSKAFEWVAGSVSQVVQLLTMTSTRPVIAVLLLPLLLVSLYVGPIDAKKVHFPSRS